MNEYAVIQCVNGNFSVKSEWTDLNKAKVNYHAICSALWNASDVKEGYVAIVGRNLHFVGGYNEAIFHEAETSSADA
jgi:hypothetical protein